VSKKTAGAADYMAPLDKPSKASRASTAKPKEPKERKVRATYYLSRDVSDRARNAATALMGPPSFETLAAIVERGVAAEVQRLEKAHNKGKPFPERAAELRGGRRLRR